MLHIELYGLQLEAIVDCAEERCRSVPSSSPLEEEPSYFTLENILTVIAR
jgi:hypothetical protein